MKTNTAGVDLIKGFERLELEAYRCSSGVPSIGYGHTKNVQPGDKITKRKAEQFLREDLAEAEEAVMKYVLVELNENQFSALVSFTFNTGTYAFRTSTLLKMINSEKWSEVRPQMLRWVYGTDRKTGRKIKLNGLVRRRTAEYALFSKPLA